MPDDLAFALEDGQRYTASRQVRAVAALRERRLREVEALAAQAIVRTGELTLAGLPVSRATMRSTRRARSALGATWAQAGDVHACVLDVGRHVWFEFADDTVRAASYVEAAAPSALAARAMMQTMTAPSRLYGPAAGTDGPARPGEAHQARWDVRDSTDVQWRVSLLTDPTGLVVRYERSD